MSFVEILKVIVLGIVEGFTEWLPISSTGHMILVDEIIHLDVSEAYRYNPFVDQNYYSLHSGSGDWASA